jgi:UDP-glucose 4-epimerase
MVDRLLRADAGEVRVFSRDEAKQDAMRVRLGDDRVRFYLGDVRDTDAIRKATRGVEFVFHAAALKQVPSCEFFPIEAVRTNVVGTANVIEACERNAVARLVLLSTDKSVHPVNAMGMTKALMEKVAQAHARNVPASPTLVACVRYGNVMYSRGSVIPLFVDQIRRGEPLTVTDPSMTRFLMSLADSVRLVEHAFSYAEPGDVFVQKANACTIGDLAAATCHLFGVPAKVRTLGIRHGEKLHETLASREELSRAEDHGDHFRVRIDSRDLNYALYFNEGDPDRAPLADYTSQNAPRLDVAGVIAELRKLPELRDVTDLVPV